MNIIPEFCVPSMIHSSDIEHHNIKIETSLFKQFVRSFKHDDINKSCILLSDIQTHLITTFKDVPKLRYRTL